MKVVDRMVGLAETLPENDVVFGHLVEAVTEVFDLAGASVLISDNEGEALAVSVTTPAVVSLADCQVEYQRGPGCDAYREARTVDAGDVALVRQRWPKFADVAARLGVAAVASFPLFREGEVMGSLDLYSSKLQQWSTAELDAARVLARFACAQLINSVQVRRMKEVAEQLEHALESRIIIEQAKGVLAASDNIDTELAFERLRQHARKHRTSVREIAQAVVEYRVRI
ncbi:ANTAR domain-containing response regulator [Rhodococcoides yunnanense]|uniref:ANTAR domain-containing response regulator n=1 Tax=Rhodococcoides yunnanense TaxID=278209 RepID=UPI0009327908|nr:GAF and ANTAR domain-containing protein [Rhodococcus yunnanensis]